MDKSNQISTLGDLRPRGLWKIIQASIKAVPAVRYALGIAGILAALALVKGLFASTSAALTAAAVMICLMVLLLIFATATKLAPQFLRLPSVVLVWFILILFCTCSTLCAASVFFQWPQPFVNMMSLMVPSRHDPSPPPSMDCIGTVIDAKNRWGLADTLVQLYPETATKESEPLAQGKTDGNGVFHLRLNHIPENYLRMKIIKSDYETAELTIGDLSACGIYPLQKLGSALSH